MSVRTARPVRTKKLAPHGVGARLPLTQGGSDFLDGFTARTSGLVSEKKAALKKKATKKRPSGGARKKRSDGLRLLAEQAAQREHDRLRGLVVAATESDEVRERAFKVLALVHETVLQGVRNPAMRFVVPAVSKIDGVGLGIPSTGVLIAWRVEEELSPFITEVVTKPPKVVRKQGHLLQIEVLLFPGYQDHVRCASRMAIDFDATNIFDAPPTVFAGMLSMVREKILSYGMQSQKPEKSWVTMGSILDPVAWKP
jgi:siroheme synthase (precorrin-2 oxidase/ferrochelatase)